METKTSKTVALAKPEWQYIVVDFLKLLGALILALMTFVLSVRGGLLYISYVRAPDSWTYLITPILMMATTAIYLRWVQRE